MKKNIRLTVWFCLSIFGVAFAQTNTWTSYINPERMTDFVETSTEIWLATKGGLFKLDKTTQTLTQFNSSNSGLPSDLVESVAIAPNNDLWIGTYQRGLVRFDGTTWENFDYPTNFISPMGAAILTNCVKVDNQGIVWVGTNVGLVRFDGTNWQLFNSQTNLDAIFLQDVWALNLDNQGNVFAASLSLYRYDGTSFQSMTDTTNLFVYNGAILSRQGNGDLWLSNKNGGLGHFDGATWTTYQAWNGDIPFNNLLFMDESPTGEMYLIFQDSGKYVFQNGIWIKDEIIDNNFVNENELKTYFYDAQGNEWFGNSRILVKNTGQNLTTLPMVTHTIENNYIQGLFYKDGVTYIVNNNEISTFDGTNWGKLTTAAPFPPLTFAHFNGILITENNHVWLSTNYNGLMHWNGTVWQNYSLMSGNFISDYIREMRYDEVNQVFWCGTSEGLAKFNGTTWTYFNTTNAPFISNIIYTMEIDNFGNVWVALVNSFTAAVLKYDGTTWQNTVTGNANAPQGYLSDLFFDKNNNLWAASWYDGLYRFDGNTWQHWTDLNSDLPHNNTQAITSDGDSTIFVGTDSGLAAFDGTNWQVWTQDNSGLCNDDVTFIEFLKNEQQLWIGTEQGLCVYQFATVGTQPTAQLAPSMRVFPNPLETSATLEFQTKQPINDAHLKIVTTTGQVITDIILPKYEVGTHQIELKREQLAAGMYFLVLQFNGQSFMQSLLVR